MIQARGVSGVITDRAALECHLPRREPSFIPGPNNQLVKPVLLTSSRR